MAEPQLCQILIQTAPQGQANEGLIPARAFYPVGLNGRYKCKLIGVSFADKTDAKDNRIIYIRSDSIRKSYGASNAIMICSRHEHANLGGQQGEFPFYLETNGGGIDIELQSSKAYTGVGNDYFQFCILSFAVQPLE
jgi:hypothetical protein